jgi:hypothetical protein
MNRIVIVGNGFDLAHGLASRYEDFVVDLLKQAITKCYNDLIVKPITHQASNHQFNFENLIIIRISAGSFNFSLEQLLNFTSLEKFNELHSIELDKNFPNSIGTYQGGIMYIQYISTFFESLIDKENWSDIERTYFNLLVQIKERNLIEVEALNKEFETIKKLFITYIIQKEKDLEIKENLSIMNLLENKVFTQNLYDVYYDKKTKERVKRKMTGLTGYDNLNVENVFFINFNYTTVLDRILQKTHGNSKINHVIIPIHGQLTEPNNIVFGYGDENNDEYKVFENKDGIEWLKHFKSHYYASTDAYSRLLNMIESGVFDVCVVGHSLGMSDKVLLSTIFEHPNCTFIHLTHRDENVEPNSHFEKRIALSRHFKDKALMRSKLMEQNEALKI